MGTLQLVVLDVLLDDVPNVPLAEQDHLVQALVLDGPDEALGVGVQVGAALGRDSEAGRYVGFVLISQASPRGEVAGPGFFARNRSNVGG